MHADELDVEDAVVRRLITDQFPQWSELPIARVRLAGTVNAIFRLGDHLSVRLARLDGPTKPGGKEIEWLPRLAHQLPIEIPVPVAQGHPTAEYPWFWDVVSWVEGEMLAVEAIDAIQAAHDLAHFVAALQRVDSAGPPRVSVSRWQAWTTAFGIGAHGLMATRRSQTSGSVRSPPLRGLAHRCGITETSMPVTGWCAISASPA